MRRRTGGGAGPGPQQPPAPRHGRAPRRSSAARADGHCKSLGELTDAHSKAGRIALVWWGQVQRELAAGRGGRGGAGGARTGTPPRNELVQLREAARARLARGATLCLPAACSGGPRQRRSAPNCSTTAPSSRHGTRQKRLAIQAGSACALGAQRAGEGVGSEGWQLRARLQSSWCCAPQTSFSGAPAPSGTPACPGARAAPGRQALMHRGSAARARTVASVISSPENSLNRLTGGRGTDTCVPRLSPTLRLARSAAASALPRRRQQVARAAH